MSIDFSKFIIKKPTVKDTSKTGIDFSKFITKKTTKIKPKENIYEPEQKKTANLPEHLGGGQYYVGKPGELITEEKRGYGGLPIRHDKERDHIVSFALGGTNNIKNVEYKTSPRDNNDKWIYDLRQGGKVVVEEKTVQDYKDGKISLPEARAKIAHKNQQIKGLTPQDKELTVAGQIIPAVKDMFGGLFGKAKETVSNITNRIKKGAKQDVERIQKADSYGDFISQKEVFPEQTNIDPAFKKQLMKYGASEEEIEKEYSVPTPEGILGEKIEQSAVFLKEFFKSKLKQRSKELSQGEVVPTVDDSVKFLKGNLNLVKDLAQGTAKSTAGLVLQKAGIEETQPQEFFKEAYGKTGDIFSKVVFGEENLKSSEKEAEEIFDLIGATKEDKKKYALPFGVTLAMLDLLPEGGTTKQAFKNISKLKNVDDIIIELRKIFRETPENDLIKMAETLVPETTETGVNNIIKKYIGGRTLGLSIDDVTENNIKIKDDMSKSKLAGKSFDEFLEGRKNEIKNNINEFFKNKFPDNKIELENIDIVGSFAKGKKNPNDIDVAISIVDKKTGKKIENFLDLPNKSNLAKDSLKINKELETLLSNILTDGKKPAEALLYGVQKERPNISLRDFLKTKYEKLWDEKTTKAGKSLIDIPENELKGITVEYLGDNYKVVKQAGTMGDKVILEDDFNRQIIIPKKQGKIIDTLKKDVLKGSMRHRPGKNGLVSNIPEDVLPDFYKQPNLYHYGGKEYNESVSAIMKIKNKPNDIITIYRAGPVNELRKGDWVTLSKEKARLESLAEKTNINSFKVKAKDVQFAGDDITEFGYWGNYIKPPKPNKAGFGLGVEDVTKVKKPKKKIELPNIIAKGVESFAPIKKQDKKVQSLFKEWTRKLLKGEQKANEYIEKIPRVNDNFKTILDYEKGIKTEYSNIIKKEFDKLYDVAKQNGVDVGYRKNYIPQRYNNTTKEVQEAMAKYMKDKGVADDVVKDYISGIKEVPKNISTRLKVNPSFSKERAFPNYETALKYKLTPKYKEPSQLLANYKMELETTIANKEFLNDLVKEGKVVKAEKAKGDFQPINIPFSPKGYFAEPKLAKMLNGMYRNEEMLGLRETAVKGVGTIASVTQQIMLSAGIPLTVVNMFVGGQVIKNLTAGELRTLVSFFRANSNKLSIKFFTKNREYLERMANQGINIVKNALSYDDIYSKFNDIKGFKEKVGYSWNKLLEEKTFKNFMPMIQTQTFKSVYDKAIKKGLSAVDAEKLAGDTTKAFYGLMEEVGRGKGTMDFIRAILFAPRFREGIINTLFNTGKSVTTELFNPAFRKNRKLIGGMILSYAGYNALNQKLTGHSMQDNPTGKEFSLMIPTKKGKEKDDILYIPFMPSFLAFARNMVSGGLATVKGDADTAKQKFASLFSTPIKLLGELWANKDYFGRDIYNENDTKKEIMKDMAGYVFGFNKKGASGGVNHPFIRETYNQIFTDKPLYQSLAEVMEMPVKFGTMTKVKAQKRWEAIYKVKEEKAKIRKAFKPRYDKIKALLEAGKVREAEKAVSKEEMTEEEYKLYRSFVRADKNRADIDVEIKIFDKYEQVIELDKKGDEEGAKKILNNMTDEEYSAYRRLYNKLN